MQLDVLLRHAGDERGPATPSAERRMLTALFRLQLAQRRLTAGLGAEAGLGESELVALGLLADGRPVPVGALAAGLGLNPGSTSTLVARLASAGLVDRAASRSDRRVQLVRITAEGEAVMAVARARYTEALGGVPEEGLLGASAVLAELTERLASSR